MKKKILSVVFAITWFVLFFLMGSMDEGSIDAHTAFWGAVANFFVMGYSGFASGLLELPDDNGGGNGSENKN